MIAPVSNFFRRYGLLLVPLVFLSVFFLYPLASILGLSFAPEGQLDLREAVDTLLSPWMLDRLWFTTWQAAASTGLTLVLALPGAFVFTRYRFPGKSLLLSLSTLPFVLPTVVVAVAFSALIGPRGLLNQALMSVFSLEEPAIHLEGTIAIILIVHVFYNYAVALRIIAGFWANQNPQIEEAARTLGCHGWRLWWAIRLPILRPAILAAAALVFIFTFTSFGVVLMLGGTYRTLEVEIYRQAVPLFNLPVAATLSLVQIGVMIGLMVIYTRFQQQAAGDLQRAGDITRRPQNRREWAGVIGNLALMSGLLFTPLIALVWRSFTVGSAGFTIEYYRELGVNTRNSVTFVAPTAAIGNSLFFAVLTMILAVSLGLVTAYLLSDRSLKIAKWLDPLFMVPLATSAVTLGLGFIIAFSGPPINLLSSWVLIPLAHTLVAMPFVVRSVLPALRGINPNLQEAARVLGASPWQVWRLIELPLISRAIVVGATFAFTISVGEFGATVFINRADTPTMPVIINRLFGRPEAAYFGQALALSAILMLVCGISFVLTERFRTVGAGEF